MIVDIANRKVNVIPGESLVYLENMIYLPMLIKILEKDLLTIEVSQIKLNRPYIKMISRALENVHIELKKSDSYLHQNGLQLVREGSDKDFTAYAFYYAGEKDVRRYSNIRLRNRTEELIGEYFDMKKRAEKRGR